MVLKSYKRKKVFKHFKAEFNLLKTFKKNMLLRYTLQDKVKQTNLVNR